MLDTKLRRWASVPYEGARSYILSLHTANLVADSVLMFGVKKTRRGNQDERLSRELYIFDPLLLEMRSVPTYGEDSRPTFRYSHTADVYSKGNILVIVGGRTVGVAPVNQLFILDLSSWRWDQPSAKGPAPPHFERHGSCLVDSKLFIYGGDMWDSNLYSIDLGTMVWDKVNLIGVGGGRVAPSMVHVGMGRLLIYGGHGHEVRLEDAFIVESSNRAAQGCHKLSREGGEGVYMLSGSVPSGRSLARMVYTRDVVLMLSGDVNDSSDYHELVPL